MEMQGRPFKRQYRLMLDFEVELNQETSGRDDNGDDQEEDEQRRRQCVRQLVEVLLAEYRDQLDVWSRAYVVEGVSETELDLALVKEITAKLPYTSNESEVIAQAQKKLPLESSLFLEELHQRQRFDDVMRDILTRFKIRLVGASFQGDDVKRGSR